MIHNDIMSEFERMDKEIEEIEDRLDTAKEAKVQWCRSNRNRIMKHWPVRGIIYEIIDIKKEMRHWDVERYCNNDEVYYFRPSDVRFYPADRYRSWRSDTHCPTVTGDIIDANKRKLTEHCIPVINIKPIETPMSDGKMAATNVYIMIDKNTGYYKIGRSVKPYIRESTLQSEKPTIELLHTFEASVRDEYVLHETFREKRIRGEWFDLCGSDIQTIQAYFDKDLQEQYA